MQYIRKNVQLTVDQAEQLRQLAFDSRLSEAEHIRRALKQYLKETSKNSLTGGSVIIKNNEPDYNNKRRTIPQYLIGEIVIITNKESDHYNEWGIITHYDGEYYHIAPWCETLEIAERHSHFFFKKQEFTLKNNKTS